MSDNYAISVCDAWCVRNWETEKPVLQDDFSMKTCENEENHFEVGEDQVAQCLSMKCSIFSKNKEKIWICLKKERRKNLGWPALKGNADVKVR